MTFSAPASSISIHWIRRDMRMEDNRTLLSAMQTNKPVLVAFIFDQNILSQLDNPEDRRVTFIHQELAKLQQQLEKFGSTLHVGYGEPEAVWRQWLRDFEQAGIHIDSVHVGRDYEPYAQTRDRALASLFDQHGIGFKGVKDHVIFEKSQVTKDDGLPYTVFTPYSKKWRQALTPHDYAAADSLDRCSPQTLVQRDHLSTGALPTLASMGFRPVERAHEWIPDKTIQRQILKSYGDNRDFPAVAGTSRLSLHLRFGTVSIREALRAGLQHSEKWTTELIWRDFYQTIIYHFPHSATDSFRPAYDAIPWDNNEAHFAAWCEGRTGYPLVDAGMRELVQTGFMHNRVRMVVASFLCKHLLTDWRWGERFFARHLLDFDLASNAGGWQWAAGSGCDAAPYFRVFNPTAQFDKFDKDKAYVRKWVPEYGTSQYPEPIVDHATARIRAIETYKSVLKPV